MKLNPYLGFDGECEAAFKFYEQCLGGKIAMKMADQSPPELRDKIMHVTLTVGDFELMGSDAPPHMVEKPQGFHVSLAFDNVAEAERIYHALAENGTVTMPLQATFWSAAFAMLVDRFGTPWMINCDMPA
jgi:PhnB protein